MLFAATAARAALESDGQSAGLGELAVWACAASDDAVESQTCGEVRLRWGLCEHGFRSEHLGIEGVDECFVRSFQSGAFSAPANLMVGGASQRFPQNGR